MVRPVIPAGTNMVSSAKNAPPNPDCFGAIQQAKRPPDLFEASDNLAG